MRKDVEVVAFWVVVVAKGVVVVAVWVVVVAKGVVVVTGWVVVVEQGGNTLNWNAPITFPEDNNSRPYKH